jgi:hypothetical protein
MFSRDLGLPKGLGEVANALSGIDIDLLLLLLHSKAP